MSDGLRVALTFGLVPAGTYLALRQIREDRLALTIGGAMLLAVFVRTSMEALRHACWTDRR